jgi:hypothetical protein
LNFKAKASCLKKPKSSPAVEDRGDSSSDLAFSAYRFQRELRLQGKDGVCRFSLGNAQASPEPDFVCRNIEACGIGRDSTGPSGRNQNVTVCLGAGRAATDVVLQFLPHVEDIDDVVAITGVGN